MEKRYKASRLLRIFSFGIKRHGARIKGDTLYIYHDFRKTIDITRIVSIKFWYKLGTQRAPGYFISTINGIEAYIPYSLMEGVVKKELFSDILFINPSISLDETTRNFLASEIKTKKRLKFDFVSHKGQRLKMDAEFIQQHPSLDAALALGVVFCFIVIPFAFGLIGDYYFIQTIGEGYPIYRNIIIVISALALCTALMNVIMSLISQYLGHKVTIISVLLFLVFIAIGLL